MVARKAIPEDLAAVQTKRLVGRFSSSTEATCAALDTDSYVSHVQANLSAVLFSLGRRSREWRRIAAAIDAGLLSSDLREWFSCTDPAKPANAICGQHSRGTTAKVISLRRRGGA
jgi:hypothetical protein